MSCLDRTYNSLLSYVWYEVIVKWVPGARVAYNSLLSYVKQGNPSEPRSDGLVLQFSVELCAT